MSSRGCGNRKTCVRRPLKSQLKTEVERHVNVIESPMTIEIEQKRTFCEKTKTKLERVIQVWVPDEFMLGLAGCFSMSSTVLSTSRMIVCIRDFSESA